MNKHRSTKFMFLLTLAMLAFAILFYSLVPKIDVQEFDQKQMNGAAKFQARKMLAERTEP